MALGSNEGYVRVVWSKGLVHGLGGGFAFIIRPDRLIGSKKFTGKTVSFEMKDPKSEYTKMKHFLDQFRSSIPDDWNNIKDPEELRRLFSERLDEQLSANATDESPGIRDLADMLRLLSSQLGVKPAATDGPSKQAIQVEGLVPAMERVARDLGVDVGGAQMGTKQEISRWVNDWVIDKKTPAKTLVALEIAKRFEFARDEIQSIEVTPPRRSGSGKIVIRTPHGEQNVKVTGELATGAGATFDTLVTWLEEFAPGELIKMG